MSQGTHSIDNRTTNSTQTPTARDPEDLCNELEPVAYLFETWSDMSREWEAGIRQSREAIPDDVTVRNVTPLVTVSSVESMLSIEQFRQERARELGNN